MDTNLEDIKNKVIEKLKTVYDPEIPVNIYELGLVYDIQVTEAKEVVVLMTLTAANCPEAEALPIDAQEKIKEIPEVTDARVIITFDPPWDMGRLSDEAKYELGWI